MPLDRLTPKDSSPVYDLAVIGGGIAGVGIARDAALRGLSVILYEKNTLASGTSSKSSKLIHGGLRYLETAWTDFRSGCYGDAWKNFRFVFVSLKETRSLERIAPGLVIPLALVIPIKKGGRPKWVIWAGCLLYFILAQLSGGARFPRFHSKKSLLKRLPGLDPQGVIGGVTIWDRWADDVALVRATAASATRHGAVILENTRVERWKYNETERFYDLTALTANGPRTVHVKKIVNASGPWVDKIRQAAGDEGPPHLLPIAGAHLTLKRFLPNSAILEAEDGRVFFVINIGDTARVGTTERRFDDPDTVEATSGEIGYLLKALENYFPGNKFTEKDILTTDAGIRPLARPKNNQEARHLSREHDVQVGIDGVIHVIGVKLTDHRRAAEKIVDALVAEFSRGRPEIKRKSETATRPLAAK